MLSALRVKEQQCILLLGVSMWRGCKWWGRDPRCGRGRGRGRERRAGADGEGTS